jgi:hypothetical protein
LNSEDLACAGFRRADDFADGFADLNREAFEEAIARLPKPPKPHQPRKPNKPTLESVKKQVSKAGIEVASIEIKPDGSFVVTAKSESAEPNPWLAELRRKEAKG